jgi:hypothetical protein
MIQFIAEGSVGDTFGTMFTMFINNRLDKMISPNQILLNPNWDNVKSELHDTIGLGASYRADIASVMATRLINFTTNYSNTQQVTDKILERVKQVSISDVFTNDIKYHIIKNIISGNKAKFTKLMMDPEIVKMAVK